MVISIKSVEADRLVRELVGETGETITEAVICALQERLEKFHHAQNLEIDRIAVRSITNHYQSLPSFDRRTLDEILGYDNRGLL